MACLASYLLPGMQEMLTEPELLWFFAGTDHTLTPGLQLKLVPTTAS